MYGNTSEHYIKFYIYFFAVRKSIHVCIRIPSPHKSNFSKCTLTKKIHCTAWANLDPADISISPHDIRIAYPNENCVSVKDSRKYGAREKGRVLYFCSQETMELLVWRKFKTVSFGGYAVGEKNKNVNWNYKGKCKNWILPLSFFPRVPVSVTHVICHVQLFVFVIKGMPRRCLARFREKTCFL